MHNAVNDIFSRCSVPGLAPGPAFGENQDMELRIGELLVEKGATQTDMAHALSVKPSTVSKWVSGSNSPPTKKLEEIAEYFGVEPIFLFRKYAGTEPQRHILSLLHRLDAHSATAVSRLVESLLDPSAI